MQSNQKLQSKSKQQKFSQLINQYPSQNIDQKDKVIIISSWIRTQHLYEFKKVYYESKEINKMVKQIKVLDSNNNHQQQQFQQILQEIIKKYVENSNKAMNGIYSLENVENMVMGISEKMKEELKNNNNTIKSNHELINSSKKINNPSTKNYQQKNKQQPNQQQSTPPLNSPSKPKPNSLFVQKPTPIPEQNIFKNDISSPIQKQQQTNKQTQQTNKQNQQIIQIKQNVEIQKQKIQLKW